MTDSLRDQLQASLGSAYRIERELGGGGMSRVYEAEETRFARRVVVKVLSPELAAAISIQRFEREIQLAAQLQQANIVPVITAGDSEGLPYFTMPFVEGESLRARLADGPLSIGDTISVLRDVARALAYAHARGIVHRDIKPDNVLLSGAAAMVTDFGIAKALSDAAGDQRDGSRTNLTQMGMSIGTPAYMAPEQAAGDPDVDHRADLYAFGCMAYELLTGAPPFSGRTPQRVLAAHMSEMPRPVSELRAHVPASLAELVMQTLEKDPEGRPGSASAMLGALEKVSAGASSEGTMPNRDMLARALGAYVGAFVIVALVTRLAVSALALPDWVFPGALVVMALGLPVVLFTAYAHSLARRGSVTTSGGILRSDGQRHGTLAAMAVQASPHLSWRRTWKGGVVALAGFITLVALFMILRSQGIGPFGSLLAAGKLQKKDPLLMTDFRVVNSDSSLGGVISQAVRSNLEQSQAISLVPQNTVTLALERMQRPRTTRLDLPLAQEVAAREGFKAIVDGEIAGVGQGYLVTVRLVTADSGRELASFREAADGVKGLIGAVDMVTRKLRERIGESLRDVRDSPPLAQVTTGSIEALRKYTAAVQATANLDAPSAARLAREAIALDTGFALAYRHLSESLSNLHMKSAEGDSALTKAFRMRDRLALRERKIVEADYYASVAMDRAKAIDAYEAVLASGVYSETNSLANLYASRRDYARVDSLAAVRTMVDPGNLLTSTNYVGYLDDAGDWAKADSVLRAAQQRFPAAGKAFVLPRVQHIAMRDGLDAASRLADSAMATATPDIRVALLEANASFALTHGRLRELGRLAAERDSVDVARGGESHAVSDSLRAIMIAAVLLPQTPGLADRVDAVVRSSKSADLVTTSMAYALVGSPAKARATLDRFERALPDTSTARIARPRIQEARAEIAIAENRAPEAIAMFRQADLLPDGPRTSCVQCLYAQLARAWDRADNPDSTAAYIERYLDVHSATRFQTDPYVLAPFLKRLGEIQESRKEYSKARASYQRFLDLWKNADSELQPKVIEVRQRIARLPRTG